LNGTEALEASGLVHLVSILAAIYDNEIGALIIDEPEVSLHPQLQAFLFKEIQKASGTPSAEGYSKIIILATHSTEMIHLRTPTDLSNIIFCNDSESAPVQISPDTGELQSQKLKGLIARIGQEHKLALFSKSPLLVEGPSDSIICNTIANHADLNIEAAGSQILPVIGKGEMPIVAKLFSLAGKTPIVLADADGFTDGMNLVNHFTFQNLAANELATEGGFSTPQQMAQTIYTDFCAWVEENWDKASELFSQHPYWKNKKMIPRLRSALYFAPCFQILKKTCVDTLRMMSGNRLKNVFPDSLKSLSHQASTYCEKAQLNRITKPLRLT